MTKEEWQAEARRRAEVYAAEIQWIPPRYTKENLKCDIKIAVLAGIAIGAKMMRDEAAKAVQDISQNYMSQMEGQNSREFALMEFASTATSLAAQAIRALPIPGSEEGK
jgi:hypothetical protein